MLSENLGAKAALPMPKRDYFTQKHRPRRRFSQNFLHDPAIIKRIVAAIDPKPEDRMVEIGPGLGALTQPLLERLRVLHAIELDRDLAQALREELRGEGELRVHNVDALTFDFGALGARTGKLRIVGNLPYHISTPLLFKLLRYKTVIRDMHFMLQREVVERMAATPGTSAYGRLSVMTQYDCDAVKLFIVGSGAFKPAPEVESAMIRLTVRSVPSVAVADKATFDHIVARAFSQRRKTIRNSLRELLNQTQMRASGVDPGLRPETLNGEDFAALSNAFTSSRYEQRHTPNRS